MNIYIAGFLIGRLIVGLFFCNSGWNHFRNLKMLAGYSKSKNVPAPELAVGGSGVLLVLGGLSLLLGFHPTAGSGLLIIFLVVASFTIHNFWAVQDPNAKIMDTVNFMKNMALAGFLLMLTLTPKPWPWSV